MRVKYKGKGDNTFKPENLIIHHGIANMPLSFLEVTQEIQSFMNKSRQEFIILSFEGEEQRNSKGELQDASNDVLNYLFSALGH